jgi:hypothetical protein
MTISTPQRIIELWPALTESQREALLDLAESAAKPTACLHLTDAETAALAQSMDDFSAGRTLSFEEAEATTNAFLAGLRAKA